MSVPVLRNARSFTPLSYSSPLRYELNAVFVGSSTLYGMQGLQQYGGSSSSSDDDDAQQASSAVARPAPARTGAAHPKRRKRLTLHLPPEIQAALEGRTAIDSDSDDETLAAAKRRRVRNPGSEQQSLAGLLNVLPPVKGGSASSSSSGRTAEVAASCSAKHTIAPKPPTQQAASPSKSAAAWPSKPMMATAAAAQAAEPTRTAAGGTGSVDADFGLISQLPCRSDRQQATQSAHEPVVHLERRAMAHMGPQLQQHQQHQQHYEHLQHQQNTKVTPTLFDQAPGHQSRESRRHGRRLERMLASGNFDGVEGQLQMHDVSAVDVQHWAASGQSDNVAQPGPQSQSNQPESGFWSTEKGAVVQSAKPNKLHKRKHQINTLAFEAAAREVDLLNQRGQSVKTKAETQAKYGW